LDNALKKRKLRAMKTIRVIAITLSAVFFLSACALFLPTPGNEQIIEAITASNNAQEEPLELVYEEMQVPHRLSGKAQAVVWVPDKSIQRNFQIAYDKKTKTFYVESFITLLLDEDGSYRKEQP
jgi:hypothetical protein